MERVWKALRGARWLPPGNIQLRFTISNQPPYHVCSVGIAPLGADPQQLWLAAAAAGAIFIAADSFTNGHDRLDRVIRRRLPREYNAQDLELLLTRLTT